MQKKKENMNKIKVRVKINTRRLENVLYYRNLNLYYKLLLLLNGIWVIIDVKKKRTFIVLSLYYLMDYGVPILVGVFSYIIIILCFTVIIVNKNLNVVEHLVGTFYFN